MTSSIIHPGRGEPPAYMGAERRSSTDAESYFNKQFEAEALYLEPGQTIWSEDTDKMIVATVGSGVVVSICDVELKMGVLGYVLIPDELVQAFPYFDKADEKLLRKAFEPIEESVGHMKRHGAGKNRIRMRLMGGCKGAGDALDAGTKNYVFTREFIHKKGLAVLNEDMGGPFIRRVHYFPATGRCVRRMLRRASDFEMIRALEAEYQSRVRAKLEKP